MERKTILYIMFIFFALGASIELLKDLSRHKRFIRSDVENNTHRIEDYDVKLGTDSAPEIQLPKVNGFDSIPAAPKSTATPMKTKDKKKVAANKKDEKKDEKKKKKKKKNKTVSPDGEVNQVAKNNSSPNKDSFPATRPFASGFPYNTQAPQTQPNTGANNPNNKNGLSLQQWEKILLGSPSLTDVQNFITAHRKGTVTDTDYFTITRMMIEDTRSNIRAFSLTILDGYLSTGSFDLLAEGYFNEPANSDFRSLMDQHISLYSQFQNFKFLASGLSTSNSTGINTIALNTLQKALVLYQPQLLSPNAVTTLTPTSATTGTNRITSQQLVTGFKTFITPLRSLVTEKDPNISAKANFLLNQIMMITSTNPMQTTAPAVAAVN